MSRPVTRQSGLSDRRSTRAYGDAITKGPATVGLTVEADLNVAARTRDPRAEALARSLGIVAEAAQPLILKRIEDSARQAAEEGIFDAQTGKGELRKDAAYLRGFRTAKAKADMVAAKAEWAEIVQSEGLADADPDTYNERQEQFVAQRFDYLADNLVAREALLPDLMKWQEQDRLQQREVLIQARKDEHLANAGAVLLDAAREQKLDASTVLQTHQMLRDVMGGSAANQEIVNLMTALAIESGDPALLDLLPSEFPADKAGGKPVPGVTRIPKLAVQIQNARTAAERNRDSRLAEETRQREEQRNIARRESRNKVANDIVNGNAGAGLATAKALLDAGVLDFEDYRALQNFHEDVLSDAGGGDDEGSVAALDMEVKLRAGEATVTDLMQSNLSVKEKRRLLPLAGREEDSKAKNLRGDIKLRFTPPKSLGGEVRGADIQLQADALQEFDDLIESGQTPRQAYDEIRKRYPERFKEAPAAPGQQTIKTPQGDVKVAIKGAQ